MYVCPLLITNGYFEITVVKPARTRARERESTEVWFLIPHEHLRASQPPTSQEYSFTPMHLHLLDLDPESLLGSTQVLFQSPQSQARLPYYLHHPTLDYTVYSLP